MLGAVNGIKAAVGVMRPQGSGSIVLTASVSGLTAWSHAAPYCATKAAVIQLAKVAAVEYARDGIRVNCVCPGTFRSAIHDGLPPEALDPIAARHPLGLGAAADLVGPTPTWPATRPAGRPARRWSSTAATPPPERASTSLSSGQRGRLDAPGQLAGRDQRQRQAGGAHDQQRRQPSPSSATTPASTRVDTMLPT